MATRRAVRRDLAARRDRADGEAGRRARRTPARGRGVDRRRRQRQPAPADGGVGSRQRDRRAGLHLRHRAVDRQPGGRNGADRRRSRRWRVRLPDLATARAGIRSWQARRDSGASRRGRSSTSCGINISSRSNRAAHRAGIRSWSVRKNKDLVVRARNGYIAGQSRPSRLGGSDMLRKLFFVVPDHGAGHRWVDGLRHQEVRAHPASAK